MQRTVAMDEQRHAELAWSVLEFALARGGDEVRQTVLGLRDVAMAPADDATEPEGFERDGRLGARAGSAVAARQQEQSRARLQRL